MNHYVDKQMILLRPFQENTKMSQLLIVSQRSGRNVSVMSTTIMRYDWRKQDNSMKCGIDQYSEIFRKG